MKEPRGMPPRAVGQLHKQLDRTGELMALADNHPQEKSQAHYLQLAKDSMRRLIDWARVWHQHTSPLEHDTRQRSLFGFCHLNCYAALSVLLPALTIGIFSYIHNAGAYPALPWSWVAVRGMAAGLIGAMVFGLCSMRRGGVRA